MQKVLHVVRRYGPATLFTAMALILTLILGPFHDHYPYVLLAGAVVASALHGGLKPGIYATVVATVALCVRYLFLSTPESPASFGAFAAQLGLAVFVGLLASYLGEHCWRAVRAADWLQTALASAGEGVVFTDAHGNITHIDYVAQQIFVCGPEVVGQHKLDTLLRIVDADTRMLLPSPVERSLSSRSETRLADPTILVTHSGAEQPISGCITPILANDGTVDGTVLVVRELKGTRTNADDAQRKQLEATVEQTKQDLQKSQADHKVIQEQLRQTCKQLDQRTGDHESAQKELQATRERHKQEIKKLSANLDDAKNVAADRQRLTDELAKRNADVAKLQRELQAAQQRLAELANQQGQSTAQAELENRLEEAQQREKKLQQQVQTMRQQIDNDLGRQITQLKADRDRLKSELDNAVERELHAEEALAQQLRPLQDRLSQTEQAKKGVENKLTEAERRARDHGGKVAELQESQEDLRRQLRDVRDTAEKHRRQGNMATSLARTIGGPVISVDALGAATFVSPAAEAMLGWMESEVLGRNVREWLLFPHTDDHRQDIELAGRTVREQEVFARRDGGMIRVVCQESPLMVDGQRSGTVISFSPQQGTRLVQRPQRPANEGEAIIAAGSRPGGLHHLHDEWLDYN
jgi:PAS domain S-box-containing protein